MSCGSPSASNAVRRAAISYSTHPKDQISAAAEKGAAVPSTAPRRPPKSHLTRMCTADWRGIPDSYNTAYCTEPDAVAEDMGAVTNERAATAGAVTNERATDCAWRRHQSPTVGGSEAMGPSQHTFGIPAA